MRVSLPKKIKTKKIARIGMWGVGFLSLLSVGFIVGDILIPLYRAPKTTDAFTLAEYYFNQGDASDGVYDLEKAERYYRQVVSEDPKGNTLAWYQLGRVYFIQGRFGDALRAFNEQQKYFGDEIPNIHYLYGLTYAYMSKSSTEITYWDRAEAHFEKYISYKPDSVFAHVDLAWVYFMQGEYEKMRGILEAVHDVENVWLQNMLGLAYYNTGRIEAAAEAFDTAERLAQTLTVEDWGRTYPGNDPNDWDDGLASMKRVIDMNKQLIQEHI